MRNPRSFAAVLGLFACAGAGAGLVGPGSPLIVDGRVHRVDLGVLGDPSDDASTVDTIRFSVAQRGLHIIDLLSWEVVFHHHHRHAMVFDLNGDGLHHFFDTEIHLFRDDGDLTPDDLIQSNGDSEFPHHDEGGHDRFRGRSGARHLGGGHHDGSVFEFDSFMRLQLAPGDYILKVGAFLLSVEDAIDGLNDTSPFNVGHYPVRWDPMLEELVAAEFGSYRATIRLVPAPSAFAPLALGLAAARRRR